MREKGGISDYDQDISITDQGIQKGVDCNADLYDPRSHHGDDHSDANVLIIVRNPSFFSHPAAALCCH